MAKQLADLGGELVSLSGGEPTLHRGWHIVARALAKRGLYVNMVTNGVYASECAGREIARQAEDAGMCNVAVSVDGPEGIHERIRGKGTFSKTLAAIGYFAAVGMKVSVMTTVNRLNFRHLHKVRQIAMDAGASKLRLQLGKPMGSMADHRDWVIEPAQLMELVPLLVRLKLTGGIQVSVGDSIGYYGPHDKVLRGWGWRGRRECWQGCQAGMQSIGIEADGSVKGCLSMQAKWGDGDPFVEGNLRERCLDAIWHEPGAFAYNRDFKGVEALTGHCRSCKHGWLCRGGAHCVSAAVNGGLTENPYCFFHQASLARARWVPRLERSAVAAALALSIGQGGCIASENRTDDRPLQRDAEIVDTGTPGQSSGADVSTVLPDSSHLPVYGVAPPDVGMDPPRFSDAQVPGDASEPPPIDAAQPQDVPDQRPEVFTLPAYGIEPDFGHVPPGRDAAPPPPDAFSPRADSGFRDGPLDSAPPDVQPDSVRLDALADVALLDTSDSPVYGDNPPDAAPDPDAAAPDLVVVPPGCQEVCCDCEYGTIPEEILAYCCHRESCGQVDCAFPPPDPCCVDEYGDDPFPEVDPALWQRCCGPHPCVEAPCDSDDYGDEPSPVVSPALTEWCCAPDVNGDYGVVP